MNKLDRQRPEADRLAGDVTPAALPADLVRALEWLRSHLSEPVDLDLLASVAGVRPRILESHFKTFLGTTPLGWLRRTRFANVRRALERGGVDATVTRIALASGFVQLGRFAAEYRALFGETPSTTLRRSRSVVEGGDDPIDDEAFRLTWEAIPRVFAIAPRECSEAISTLESAQRLAPDYGLPVALAAWCLGQRAAHGFGAMPEQDRNKALELVARAQTLAPNDVLALTLASGALTLAHRLEDADRVLERALALDPMVTLRVGSPRLGIYLCRRPRGRLPGIGHRVAARAGRAHAADCVYRNGLRAFCMRALRARGALGAKRYRVLSGCGLGGPYFDRRRRTCRLKR
jgi:AraC-like DNA-binding protein